jgi:hypothetical protein
MISRLAWAVLAVACGGQAVPDRDGVLSKIPATAIVVVAADGRALAHGRIRPLVDALRPELPAALGCVIDAALACDHVAVGIGADRAFTIAIATRAPVKCRALSKLPDGTWVATLGDGLVRADGASVATDPRFARARPYLGRAPIALAAELAGGKVIATAQPQPLEAWLAFDADSAATATAAEARARDHLARLAKNPATAPLAGIAVTRSGSQVKVTLAGAPAGDLGLAAKAVLAREREVAAPPPIGCPGQVASPVVECKAATFRLPARAELATELSLAAVVSNGSLVGFRLGRPLAQLGLVAGDLIVAVDGRLVTALGPVRAAFARDASFTIRRGRTEGVIRLVRSDSPLP